MSSPLSIKRWVSVTHAHEGVRFGFEVLRPNAIEAANLRVRFAQAASALNARAAEADAIRASLMAAAPPPEPPGRPQQVAEGATDAEREAHEAALRAWEDTNPDYVALCRDLERRYAADSLRLREVAARADLAILDPGLVAELFERYVRNVTGLEAEGVPVVTGVDLLSVADQHVVATLVAAVRGLCSLSPSAGKASASHSTSSPEPETGAGALGATSTASEAGHPR